MNSAFRSTDGTVETTFPDHTPRPKTPIGQAFFVGRLMAEETDIRMGWMPHFPPQPAHRVKAAPARIGVMTGPLIYPAAAPLSWMPTVLGYLAAPRLHQTFRAYKADPLSGEAEMIGARLAWMPHLHKLITRPRLTAGGEKLVIPITVAAAGEFCVELLDLGVTSPALIAQTLTSPRFISEAVSSPTLISESIC